MGKPDSRPSATGEESSASSSGTERNGKKRATSMSPGSSSSATSSTSSSSPLLLLCVSLQQLQQAVLQQDDRPIARMLRQLKSLRAKVPTKLLALAADNLLWKLAPDVVPPPPSSSSSSSFFSTSSSSSAAAAISPDATSEGKPVEAGAAGGTHTGDAAPRGTGGGGVSSSQQPQLLRVTLDAETENFWKSMRAHLDAAVLAEEQLKKDEEMQVDAEDTTAEVAKERSGGSSATSSSSSSAGGTAAAFPLRAVDFLCCSGEVEVFLCLLLLLRLLDSRRYTAAAQVGDFLVQHVIHVEERGVCEDPVVVVLPAATSAPAAAAATGGARAQGDEMDDEEEEPQKRQQPNGVVADNSSSGDGRGTPETKPGGSSSNGGKSSDSTSAAAAGLWPQQQQLQQMTSRRRRRLLDLLAAKCLFFWYRARELEKSLDQNVRRDLLRAYTVASVQHDRMLQATTLNLLLRDYIALQQYELAVKLVAKTSFPEHLRSNAQHARYLYYIGSIQAVRLEYSAAFAKLQMALRRAPQQPRLAAGFRLAVLKKAIVVELLMGDIPERATFNKKETRAALLPYKHIVLAVRSGDLHAFGEVMQKYEKIFSRDGTLFLIRRLHHNVIRAGLRLISLSYSRIPLADVAQKLGLESAAYAEGIVAKAILDGVIEATIDHEKQCVESKVNPAIYASTEPQKAFNKRIAFCLQLHADAVRAMQYPEAEEAREKKDDDADERRKALREELARVEDEDVGDDDMDLF